MNPSPRLTPQRQHDDLDGGLTHWCCCHDDDTAMCGTDLLDADWTEDDGLACVVCDDLQRTEPPICHCPCCVMPLPEGGNR